ncbi:MAG: hypothetical protein HY582_00055 [Candidatus Omnitrophica bacterium]|nr:hypothetical protein [Candidatus Omnitrophota bacterium]
MKQLIDIGTKGIFVSKPTLVKEDGECTVTFFVTTGKESQEIWFKTRNLPDVDYSDVALATTLLPAMKLGCPLQLEGEVSPQLFSVLEKMQDIYSCWFPQYQKVMVKAFTKPKDNFSQENSVGCFFTGGVDSFYTLLKHSDEISHLIFVHGFDVRLDDQELYRNVKSAMLDVAKATHKEVIEVATNVRLLLDRFTKWDHSHGAALASVALLLSAQFRKIYIASSNPYNVLEPHGSHVLLDPLWSIENTEIVHDGCEATRVEKVVRIAESHVALDYLRVCYENRNGAYNCGICEKCLRTMLNLQAVGALKKCKTLPHTFDLSRISWIEMPNERVRLCTQETLQVLKKDKNNHLIVEAVEESLSGVYYRGIWSWPRRALNFLRRKRFWNIIR